MVKMVDTVEVGTWDDNCARGYLEELHKWYIFRTLTSSEETKFNDIRQLCHWRNKLIFGPMEVFEKLWYNDVR